jgi:hypothetical protein
MSDTPEPPALTALEVKIALQSWPKVRPSYHDVWQGRKVEGSPWTLEQIATLEKRKPGSSEKRVWWYDVPLLMPRADDPWAPYRTIYLRCPLLAKSGDGRRVKIITPSGEIKWTDAKI